MANQSSTRGKAKSGTSRGKKSTRGKARGSGTAKAKSSGMSSMTGSPNFNVTKVRNHATKINQWSAELLTELPPPMTRTPRGKSASSGLTNQ